MNEIKVSVCVPIYNVDKYIEQCLESLFNQTIKQYIEYIFVNDCSKDKSFEILKRISSNYPELNIKIISHDHNKGLAAARNTALENCNGKYVCHVDSDDYIELNAIENLYNIAESNNCDLLVTGCNNIAELNNQNNITSIKNLLLHKMPVMIWQKFALLDLYKKNQISWKEGINIGEDVITSCKLLYAAEHPLFIGESFYNYRESIGFSTRMKYISITDQKVKEFNEIENFLNSKQILENFTNILNLRKAEVRHFYIKYAPVLSLKKYKLIYPDTKLNILYKERSEFNSFIKRFFIDSIDNKHYFISNLLLILFRIKNIKK